MEKVYIERGLVMNSGQAFSLISKFITAITSNDFEASRKCSVHASYVHIITRLFYISDGGRIICFKRVRDYTMRFFKAKFRLSNCIASISICTDVVYSTERVENDRVSRKP